MKRRRPALLVWLLAALLIAQDAAALARCLAMVVAPDGICHAEAADGSMPVPQGPAIDDSGSCCVACLVPGYAVMPAAPVLPPLAIVWPPPLPLPAAEPSQPPPRRTQLQPRAPPRLA